MGLSVINPKNKIQPYKNQFLWTFMNLSKEINKYLFE
jgi:hypothetical protein